MCGSFAQSVSNITVYANKPIAKVSPNLWGLFFEDINFGADGGIYAELVKNRSFEFSKPLMGWTINNDKVMQGFYLGGEIYVVNDATHNENNPRYVRVLLNNTAKGKMGLTNEGFRGMGVKKCLKYDFSALYRYSNTKVVIHLELVSEKGEVIGSATANPSVADGKWNRVEASFTSSATDPKAKLNVWFEGSGTFDIDMISLFPTDTWKGRKGGLRADMVQMLADMKPGFIRFPGGCIVEGRDLATRYQWKNTIGPVENRKTLISRWNAEMAFRPAPDYFQSFGLGFMEYFQLAEDVGAAPLPIVNCGMACQFNTGEVVPLDDLDPYIQDALDLIEFANGAVTTKWGKRRADLGHPAPFNMTMLGVGNENWGPAYVERLQLFRDAIKKQYPDIKLVGSSGIMPAGDLFDYLNTELRKMDMELIDEHYYSSTKWFQENAKRYDGYDRKSGTKVFVGEYASQSHGQASPENKSTWLTALSEAAYLTGIERNADVVELASYAPLFAHVEGWQWKPDLIWVDNLTTMATPNYFVQKLYATNKGTDVLRTTYKNDVVAGTDGLYASSVKDAATNELIIKVANVTAEARSLRVDVKGTKLKGTGFVTTLQDNNPETENVFGEPLKIAPKETQLKVKGNALDMTLQPYSFTVVRVPLK